MFVHLTAKRSKNSNPLTRGRKTTASSQTSNPFNGILSLHKALGNRAVQRLIESGALQTKLTVGKPNDIYEQEADRVAEQVMRMPESSTKRKGVSEFNESESVQRVCEECEEELHRQTHGSGLGNLEQGLSSKRGLGGQEKRIKIQRICTECEEELNRQPIEVEEKLQMQHMEEDGVLQAKKAFGSTLDDTFGIESTVNSQRGGGQPLAQSSQDLFGSRFGADFSGVRIHTSSESDSLNRSLNAKAFTTGQDIFFRKGEYNPGGSSGKELLAHELTHVVQQNGPSLKARIQMQGATPRIPRFTNCNRNQSARVETARDRANDYVDVAISRVRRAPRSGTTYATALNRHFISPTLAQRVGIQANYRQIRAELRRRNNFICDPTNATCGGATQAFWDPADDLVHICNRFWDFGPTCRAIILIHEAAHDIGIDAAPGPHTPNRGSAQYPAGNNPPPAGQTTAGRMSMPDVYAFFAAHVWRATDTSSTCF
jgi:hypothetical protein